MSACPDSLLQLHPMDFAHLPEVLAIERQSYEFPWSETIFADCLRAGYSAWVLTTKNAKVLAYALLAMGAGEGHVLNVCTAPSHRRLGLARSLLQHLIMIGRAADLQRLLLEVRVSNAQGHALYASLGFRRIGLRPRYYPGRDAREDAVVLALDLQPPAADFPHES